MCAITQKSVARRLRVRYIIAMADLPTPQDVEILAVQADMSVAQACRDAGVSPAVFQRWKRGDTTPTLRTLEMILSVLHSAIAKRGAV
jgi:predicted transcriptional regulator